jgi:hypothetical protein
VTRSAACLRATVPVRCASERHRPEPEFAVRLDPRSDRVGVPMEPTMVVVVLGSGS